MAKSPEELLEIARGAVAPHLRSLGKIVKHPTQPTAGPAVARAGLTASQQPADDDLVNAIAADVGAKLGEDEPDSADVEFVEHTPVGARSTVVQVRGGKVARILKRA
jgi:hypothetical protein